MRAECVAYKNDNRTKLSKLSGAIYIIKGYNTPDYASLQCGTCITDYMWHIYDEISEVNLSILF